MIFDLDSLKDKMFATVKEWYVNDYLAPKDSDYVLSSFYCTYLSPFCFKIEMGVGLTDHFPDRAPYDKTIIVNFYEMKMYPWPDTSRARIIESVNKCKCTNLILYPIYDYKMRDYFISYNSDSVYMHKEFPQNNEINVMYTNYYAFRNYEDYKNDPRLYSFMRYQNKEESSN